MLRILSYIGLVILSILFVLTACLGTLVWSVNATVLKPYESIRYLQQSGIYRELGGIVGEMFTPEDSNPSNGQSSTPEEIELQETIVVTLQEILTEQYIASKFTPLQTNIWDYITDKSELSLVVAIPEIREQMLKAIMDNTRLPEQVKAEAPAKVNEIFPETIDFAKLLNSNAEENQSSENNSKFDFAQIKEIYHTIARATVGLYSVIVVLLALCVGISLYLKNTHRWIGTILLIPGILILVQGLAVKSVTGVVPTSDLPEAFQTSVTQLISDVSGDISSQLFMVAAIFLVASILTYMSAWMVSLIRRNRTSANSTWQD